VKLKDREAVAGRRFDTCLMELRKTVEKTRKPTAVRAEDFELKLDVLPLE
jgi:hypothetical protein